MAKVNQNLVIQGLSGSLGDQLVIQAGRGGQTIIRAKPKRRATDSPAQVEVKAKFQEAAAYAKVAVSQEPVYAEKAAGTPKTAFNVALADWFHTPEILDVALDSWTGKAGEKLRIKAHDDVKVKTVKVVIADAQGNVVEQGVATQADGLWWEYISTANCPTEQAKVIVTAEDLPGHAAEATREV